MITADFTIDAEGWTTDNGTLTWQNVGGDPGGNVRGVEGGTGRWGFLAGSEFLGDLSSYLYGSLSFDLKQDTAGTVNDVDVRLVGGGLTLVADMGSNPGTDWTGYTLNFDLDTQWHVGASNGSIATMQQIATVLGDLTSIYIRGEFVNGGSANLDNVVIAEGEPPGPAPDPDRIASTFDTDTDGWSFLNDVRYFFHEATGGVPGGYLHAYDQTTGLIWYFVAADKFLGDKSAYYGASLSWDQWQSGNGNLNEDNVIIKGAGLTLALDLPNPQPGGTWHHYAISFHASQGWRVGNETGALATEQQIRDVLADLDAIQIQGEFVSGSDNGGIDNVVLDRLPTVDIYNPADLQTVLSSHGTLAGAVAAAAEGQFIDVNTTALSEANPIRVDADNLTIRASAPYGQILQLRDAHTITLTGTGAFIVAGSATADTINGGSAAEDLRGNGGDDQLFGGAGPDTLRGGAGNDTYLNPETIDSIIESAGGAQGVDTVLITEARDFSIANYANVEVLTFTATSNGVDGTGNAGANTINGGSGNNGLAGGDGNDTLIGNAGADWLQGDAGTDSLVGGIGNDTYYNPDGDIVVELAAEGIDNIRSDTASVSLADYANVEDIVLTGAAHINGTGDANANYIGGNDGNNVLTGGDGGDDLRGDDGDDKIIGGPGMDRLEGYRGNDTYIDVEAGEVVDETASQGIDTFEQSVSWSLASYGTIENLTLMGTASDGTGNALNNVLTGNAAANNLSGAAGNDTLVGGDGADTLTGGLGDDTYVRDSRDTLVEAADEGTDTVQTDRSYALLADFENLTLTGSLHAQGTGNGAANRIIGNEGNNVLRGGGGNDTIEGGAGTDDLRGETGEDSMAGGLGNDRYFVDSAGDSVNETDPVLATGGNDTVFSQIDFTLGANLEILRLQGSGNLNGTGNELNNRISGTVGTNLLQGLGGNDLLEGNDGADTLAGGAGNDTMSGGSQADVFVFTTTLAGADTITDFNKNADRFDLGGGSFSQMITAPDGDVILTHNGGTIRIDAPLHNLTLAQYNALVLPGGAGASYAESFEPTAVPVWGGIDHLAVITRLQADVINLGHGEWVFA